MQLKNILGEVIVLPGPRKRKGVEVDARLQLAGKQVCLEIKDEVNVVGVEGLRAMQQQHGELLVAAAYISPKAKSLLTSHGIHYLDSKGNANIKIGSIYIHVEGIPNSPGVNSVRSRLFSKAGLQMLFVVLVDPRALNVPYRQLAERANVSLGTLNVLFRALQEDGYIVRGPEQNWILVERVRLLTRWVHEYVRRLRPALAMGSFDPTQPDFGQHWQAVKLEHGALWGGEPGADLLTEYLQPAMYTLYSGGTRADILKTYRWKPSAQGRISVLRKFWTGDIEFDQQAQPLLTYADLMDRGDGRSLEVARLIYDRYLRDV